MSRNERLERLLALIFEIEFVSIADHPTIQRRFEQEIDDLLAEQPGVGRTELVHAIHGCYRLYRLKRLKQELIQARRTLQS